MTAPRERLPNRRDCAIETIGWAGRSWTVCIGFAPDGRPLECFADGVRSGSQLEALVDDGCIAISLLLQFGARPEDLARAFGREGTAPEGVDYEPGAASLLGAIARRIAEIAAERGAR